LSKGIFVTGTDTNIGKTLISASLTWKLSNHYSNICFMKPFATSNKIFSEKYNSKDLFLLSKSINLKEDISNLNPYFYTIPASPYMATKLSNIKPLDIKIAVKKFNCLANKYDYLIVEGIGGIYVPLTKKYKIIDFIKLIKLPVIIVTTPKIGTVNHTLLTIEACKKYDIPIKGLVFNKMPSRPSDVEKSTPKFINELTNIPILGIIPMFKNMKFDKMTFKNVADKIKWDKV